MAHCTSTDQTGQMESSWGIILSFHRRCGDETGQFFGTFARILLGCQWIAIFTWLRGFVCPCERVSGRHTKSPRPWWVGLQRGKAGAPSWSRTWDGSSPGRPMFWPMRLVASSNYQISQANEANATLQFPFLKIKFIRSINADKVSRNMWTETNSFTLTLGAIYVWTKLSRRWRREE